MSSARQVIFINDSYFSNISRLYLLMIAMSLLVRLYLLMIAILVIFPYVFRSSGYIY